MEKTLCSSHTLPSSMLQELLFLFLQMDHNDGYVLSIPVPILRGSSDSNLNTSSDLLLELPRGRLEVDSLQRKILKLTEQLKVEQMERDDNVAEFLKLVNMADKQQVGRIRQVFEKKNQKLAQSISQLQKKLEQYHRRLKDISKDLTKDLTKELSKDTLNISGSGRHPCLDKIKTIGPGVSLSPPFFFNKPREFANLIRNKFGSADNIAQLKTSLEDSGGGGRALGGSATIVGQTKYHSDDESSTGSSASADSNGNHSAPHQDHTITMVLEELREIRQSQVRLAEEMEALKEDLKGDTFLTQTLEEEKYRVERLEEQLNDLVELHQHEMANLKQELASIEEKVAYQANERARDLQEALESCQTRLSKLEVQQQQQQAVQVEAETGRMLLGKGISVLLAVATLLLVCVSTAARFVSPVLRSRLHLLATAVAVLLLSLLWRSWEHLQRSMEGTLSDH
uniref:Transmembrane and coiled-coil domain protein 3-like n=1 Tax=Astyanax mexicanus TaxID=7994 RepID=A0A8B9GU26_ASTMX